MMITSSSQQAPVNVKDRTFFYQGFYPTGIQTILDVLARYSEMVERPEAGELASRINAVPLEPVGFTHLRLSVTDWELIQDAFMECGNDAWEASIASEISERLQHHGYRW